LYLAFGRDVKVQTPIKDTTPINNVVNSDSIKKVAQEFSNIKSKEDKLVIHKLFSGSAEYLNNSVFIGTTSQFDPILQKVQTSYGWSREKYPKFTDRVSEYLISVGYDKPKELKTQSERKAFAKIFEDLSEATKYE
jgi:hypothetical protein